MKAGQSKRMSLAEAVFNVAVGYFVSLITQAFVFPIFGLSVPLHDGAAIAGIFTLVSILRGYALRRFFNWVHHRKGE